MIDELKGFHPENKCGKCDMCVYRIEYDEWKYYCLNGKNIKEDKYCFIPLFVSRIKAKLFIEIKQRLDYIEDNYVDMAEWFEDQ